MRGSDESMTLQVGWISGRAGCTIPVTLISHPRQAISKRKSLYAFTNQILEDVKKLQLNSEKSEVITVQSRNNHCIWSLDFSSSRDSIEPASVTATRVKLNLTLMGARGPDMIDHGN